MALSPRSLLSDSSVKKEHARARQLEDQEQQEDLRGVAAAVGDVTVKEESIPAYSTSRKRGLKVAMVPLEGLVPRRRQAMLLEDDEHVLRGKGEGHMNEVPATHGRSGGESEIVDVR